jgi:outer membrane autotransporter protein
MLSFYLGYAGSKQKFDDVKTDQTGYIVGLTGTMVKNNYYVAITLNEIFNKVESQSSFGTDDFNMNMFTIGAKAGYNYNINEKWTLEPNLTLMYGIANSDSYETSQGAKIDSQNTNNILLEPQIKAKLQLTNGWQPYGLLGYAANLSGKPKVKAGGQELELDSIDGFVEYGIGVNKEFIGSVWSCYGQITGRSGGRNGFGGNFGIKYKF